MIISPAIGANDLRTIAKKNVKDCHNLAMRQSQSGISR